MFSLLFVMEISISLSVFSCIHFPSLILTHSLIIFRFPSYFLVLTPLPSLCNPSSLPYIHLLPYLHSFPDHLTFNLRFFVSCSFVDMVFVIAFAVGVGVICLLWFCPFMSPGPPPDLHTPHTHKHTHFFDLHRSAC